MQQGKKLNSAYADKIGRDGRVPKRIVEAPISPGMKHQTKDYLHGQPAPLDDEPDLPMKSHEKVAPVAYGKASRLGKPVEKAGPHGQ